MENEFASGVIRRIIIGMNPKDGMSFSTGQGMGQLVITDIIKDKNYFYKFGKIRFLIYVTKGAAVEKILWKEFIDMPTMIEYDSQIDMKLV